MADYDFSMDEFANLAERFDALREEISPNERALLFAVFQMAADNLAKRGKAQQVGSRGSNSWANPSSELEDVLDDSGRVSVVPNAGVEARLAALEARVLRLEAPSRRTAGSEENLEALSLRSEMIPTVQLRIEDDRVPKLSDGFLGSFRRSRPGPAGSAIVGDDVGVGVNVGVMF